MEDRDPAYPMVTKDLKKKLFRAQQLPHLVPLQPQPPDHDLRALMCEAAWDLCRQRGQCCSQRWIVQECGKWVSKRDKDIIR